MSMPMTSATSGSSTRRCTSSAPHQRATPVTRIRRLRATKTQSKRPSRPSIVATIRAFGASERPLVATIHAFGALVGALDDVPLHERDRARNHLEQRQPGLAQRELQLAQQRVQRLHGLDRVADVDVRRQRDLVERLARRPSVGEVDEVVRRRAQVWLVEIPLHVGEPEVERADKTRRLRDGGRRVAPRGPRLAPVTAPLAVLGGEHHNHGAELLGGQALEPAQGDGLGDQDRVLPVHARGEQAFVGRLVALEEAGLLQDLLQAPELARVLVHLPRGLVPAAVELLLQAADLAVLLQQLAEARRAHDLELALALEQALGLHLQALREAARVSHRPRLPASPMSPLGPGLAAQALELDPDRSPPLLALEVLGHVLHRDLAAIPPPASVAQLVADVGKARLPLARPEPLLEP